MIAEDTKVTKNFRLSQLWDVVQNKGLMRLRSCASDGSLYNSDCITVRDTGVLPLVRIVTRLGYKIEAFETQKLLCPDNKYHKISELSAGSLVQVNGAFVLRKDITDEQLQQKYLVENMSSQQIADEFGQDFQSVRARLKTMGIYRMRLNDYDAGKHDSRHVVANVKKAPAANPYKESRRVPEVIYVRHPKASIGETSVCELCSRSGNLKHCLDQAYHKAELTVCVECRDKLQKGWYVGTVAHSDIVVSASECSPKQTYEVVMLAPDRNYVAGGFIAYG